MKTYLEMSRDNEHGGEGWGLTDCVWSPTHKKNSRGTWPFWEKVNEVKRGDCIVHLQGISPNSNFVGYSIAQSDGIKTLERPPIPKEWGYADSFFRAELSGFIPFTDPINLLHTFQYKSHALEEYFSKNKARGNKKKNIFYVKQAGRLQCQNGAYLSEIDDELFDILFASENATKELEKTDTSISIPTSEQLRILKVRIGQTKFSDQIKRAYGNICCFPECDVSDPRFLIGAHIDRWADNDKLRGHLGNGLCLCLMHDKAFEAGLFTIDSRYQVYVGPMGTVPKLKNTIDLIPFHGKGIRLADILPLKNALLEHQKRSNIEIPPIR